MVKGIIFALSACFIWGMIFVIPQFMEGFTSIEVTLGRFLVYGLISALIFCRFICRGSCRYPRAIWFKALHLSLMLTIVYYTFVVLSLRYSTPAICALVLGISPITIAFYGNWKQKETTFKSLIVPSILILLGLVIINVPHLKESPSVSSYMLGLLFSALALSAWSWYVVANARFLKHHRNIHSCDWSTLIGVATLFWVVIFALFFSLFVESEFHIKKFFTPSPELHRFFLGIIILGFVCSWVGAFLWNKASLHLPVSLAGQLTIFETVFGVIFVYIFSQNMPSVMDGIGIGILLIAIVYGIRQFAKNKTYNDELEPH